MLSLQTAPLLSLQTSPPMFLSLRTASILLSLRTSDRCHWCGNPRPSSFRTGIVLSFRASPQTGVAIRPLNSSPFIEPPPSGGGLLRAASGGVLLSPATKYPKPPLETTFQDFLSALRPAANLLHVSRAIAFPVCRCRSKGLCHHSFPLPLRCRCPLPRQPLPPLPPYRGTPRSRAAPVYLILSTHQADKINARPYHGFRGHSASRGNPKI